MDGRQKRETRQRILDAASRQFRQHGYAGTAIDAIMAEAGLTRGGFYAHFRSKAELFAAVVGSGDGLVHRLQQRQEDAPAALAAAAAATLSDYLGPVDPQAPGCGLATLAADVARADEAARRAFSAQIDAFWRELFRGRATPPGGADTETALRILALAVGALTLARASDDRPLAEALLSAAGSQVTAWLDELAQEQA